MKKVKQNNNISLCKIGTIKIPSEFEDKFELVSNLRLGITEIDEKMKELQSRKDYYNQLVEKIQNELNSFNYETFDTTNSAIKGMSKNPFLPIIDNFKTSLYNLDFKFTSKIIESDPSTYNLNINFKSFRYKVFFL